MKIDLLIIKASVDSKMFDLVRAKVTTSSADSLFMVVRTPGGDPMYAYRTMVFLRSIYKKITFVVFDESMSAGTLMALGADSIYLEEGACLGPLDLQIPHPRDDSRISALDVRETASSTVFEASSVMLKICERNLKAGLPMTSAIDASIRMTSNLYKPVMDKIDPFHLRESYRNAELSTSYGTSLLLKGMIKKQPDAIRVSTHLANDYSYHGYAIMKEEAKNIGLKIIDSLETLGLTEMDEGTIRQKYNNLQFEEVVFIPADIKVEYVAQIKNKKEKK